MSKVCVVIPNYNGMEYIANCLIALEHQSYQDYSVVVVDNASTDGSAELVKEQFPKVQLISMSENTGFSAAVNSGILSTAAPYVLLLNNDTEVTHDFIEQMVQSISRDDTIFSVSSKMLSLHNKGIIDDAGDYYTLLGWAFARGKNAAANRFIKRNEIFSACAGAAIYRRELVCELGMFDEAHFAYLEDLDIGYRARIYGYRNVFEPSAIVYHAGSGASGSRYNEFKVRLAARNSVYVLYKNMTILQWILHFPWLCMGFFVKWLFFVRKKLGRVYRKGLSEGIALCKKKESKQKKVVYKNKHFMNYLRIEWELYRNMFLLLFYRT